MTESSQPSPGQSPEQDHLPLMDEAVRALHGVVLIARTFQQEHRETPPTARPGTSSRIEIHRPGTS